MRLIDADVYLKKVCTYNETGCGSCRLQTKCPVDEPTVDAVEVIRCKDCEWYEIVHLKKDGTDDRRYKPTWCSLWRAVMSEEDYCSWAERKEE